MGYINQFPNSVAVTATWANKGKVQKVLKRLRCTGYINWATPKHSIRTLRQFSRKLQNVGMMKGWNFIFFTKLSTKRERRHWTSTLISEETYAFQANTSQFISLRVAIKWFYGNYKETIYPGYFTFTQPFFKEKTYYRRTF